MAAKNILKAEALAKLISEGVDKEVAKKALGRLERWMKAAYGCGGAEGYQLYQEETGSVAAGARPYVDEIRAGANKVTFNSTAFGIQGTGHSSRRRRDE